MPAESVGCDDVARGGGAAEVALAVQGGQVLELADEHDRSPSIKAYQLGSSWTIAARSRRWSLCRAIWWNWSGATMSRERRPRSKCSKRRWINGGRSPTTTAGSPRSARGCPRRRCTASRRSTTTCSSRAGERHVRVCTGTACFAATGDAHVDDRRGGARPRARRARGGQVASRWPRPSASATATRARRCATATRSTPARARSSALLADATRPAPEPVFASLLDEPVLTRPGDWSGYAQGAPKTRPRRCWRRSRPPTSSGRGGAGFPAGVKWEFAARSPNAGQGDRRQRRRGRPRLLHRQAADGGQPAPAARGHGARGLRGRRAPRLHPRALRVPALQARAGRRRSQRGRARAAILGERFDITVVEGAGSYVVGEETALLTCLQGLRGTVSARPPFPAERGVHGLPTVVNNVETLCNIAVHRRATAPRPTAR